MEINYAKDKKNVSTEQDTQKKDPRLQEENEDKGRKKYHQCPQEKR